MYGFRSRFVTFALVAMLGLASACRDSVAAEPASAPRLPRGIPGLEAGQQAPPSADWLLGAKDDAERFRRLQILAGGTYEQMWQVGHRYQATHRAIAEQRWELARYHWTKLRDVLNVALMKRPKRTPNAEAIFLDGTWATLDAALRDADAAAARREFVVQRAACMGCHAAEGMPFLNDAPLFRETATFPD
jgi:mono/diheme cytochrome c family protein